MKKIILSLFLLLIAVSLNADVRIVTSIFPLYSIVHDVVGDHGEVTNILPPGVSPHIFEPAPREIIKLHGADLFVYVGEKVEPWAKKLLDGAGKGVGEFKFADVVKPVNNNYHFWLDPVLVIRFVDSFVDKVCEIDAVNCPYYRKRGGELVGKLKELDGKFRKALSGVDNRNVIFFHNAWFYLAKRYDLNIVDVVIKGAGRKPTPADMVRLAREVRKYKIKVIFGDMIGGVNLLKKIAENIGVGYLLLDPLGCEKCPGRNDYFSLMNYNLKVLLKGLK